jgi:hypothetical protein
MMLFTLKDIQNYRLQAVNGDFGAVKTFIIDDFAWVVRYLVAEVGSRQVLLAVQAIGAADRNAHVLPVNTTKERIMNSPTFDPKQTITREVEQRFSDYFDWPYYWEPEDVPNTMPGDLTAIPLIDMELDREQQEEQELIPQTGETDAGAAEDNRYLCSTQDIFGYTVHAMNDDRNAGKLADMVIEDEDWNIQYLMVDTGGLLPGKKVLLAPSWVQRIDQANSRIDMDLAHETIQDGPEFASIDALNSDIQKSQED